jgi:hypothetical protein
MSEGNPLPFSPQSLDPTVGLGEMFRQIGEEKMEVTMVVSDK